MNLETKGCSKQCLSGVLHEMFYLLSILSERPPYIHTHYKPLKTVTKVVCEYGEETIEYLTEINSPRQGKESLSLEQYIEAKF